MTDPCDAGVSWWWRAALGSPDWSCVVDRPLRRSDVPLWAGQRTGTILFSPTPGIEGLGDQTLCASMIPDLSELADKLIFECDQRLIPTFARSFPAVEFVPRDTYSGSADAIAGFYELCRHVRPETRTSPGAFLKPIECRYEDRFTIGLSWRSKMDVMCGPSFDELICPLLLRMPSCRFVDLQYGDTRAEREAVERAFGVEIERPIDNDDDLDGLFSLIGECDAVITVANSTQHFAGAIGKPTWALMPKEQGRAAWYWFINRTDSPWYPNQRLIWPERGQEWSKAVDVAINEIRAYRGNTERKAA